MKGDGAMRMRAIAEEAAELVRRYKGAYSGEHGDGLVRSEWIAPFFGPRLTAAWAKSSRGSTPGAHEPRQDREPAAGRTTARCIRYGPQLPAAGAGDRARLERVERTRGRAWRCATTTATAASSTRAPCARAIARRATSATSRAAAPTRCASRSRASSAATTSRRRGGARRARPLRVVQGLQARMPDRRRHGAHEDRVHRALQAPPRAHAARPADRRTCRATRTGRRACSRC